MSSNDDAFWDELGVAWRTSIQDQSLMSARLEARLRRQSALITGGTLAAGAVSLLGFGLAAWALWIGWSNEAWNFLARGATLTLVSLLGLSATLSLRARRHAGSRPVRDMLEISIGWTERLVKVADLGLYATLILAIGGSVGYALRLRQGHPPAMSLLEDLLFLGIVALALLWYRRDQSLTLRKYRHLRRVFGSLEA